MEPTSLLSPIKAGWNRLLEHARGKLVVAVRVHHAYLIHKEPPPPAWFINVQNSSPKRDVQVTHVWIETTPVTPIIDAALPVTIKPGKEWETYVHDRNLPVPDGTDISTLVRVRISGDVVLEGSPRKDVPPVGVVPR